ncbi:hypothetical protein F4809DRAFT_42604 [Biscogniauxia mediterranea]|nr:hypothetical protein F4809DRAFT_42604 [Biscogniauxia mediterranea]
MIGTHRDHAHFDRAGWRKRILLPCWIVQVGLLCGLMGIFSYRLSRTVYTWKDEEDQGQVPLVEFVWEGINILFSFISLVITLISIARFIAEALTPLPLVFSSILGLALAGAILALDIVVYVQHADRHYSLIGLGIDSALMFFTIIPAIYAIIIYRRLLAYDDYHLPGNVKPYGYAGNDADTSYMSMSGYLHQSQQPPSQSPYDPTTASANPYPNPYAPEPASRPRSLSAGRRLSLSLPSLPLSRGPSPSPNPSPALHATTTTTTKQERRASYNHRRDTQFDEYVARARRASANQEDAKRAADLLLLWSHDEPHPHQASQSQSQSPPLSPPLGGLVSAVSSVPVSQVQRARASSLGRQASLEASLTTGGGGRSVSPSLYSTATADDAMSVSALTSTTVGAAGVQRGHSLNSVPEAHEEDEDRLKHGGGGGSRGSDNSVPGDREALLGLGEGTLGMGSNLSMGIAKAMGKRADGRSSSTGSSASRTSSRYSVVDHIEGLEEIELGSQQKKQHL